MNLSSRFEAILFYAVGWMFAILGLLSIADVQGSLAFIVLAVAFFSAWEVKIHTLKLTRVLENSSNRERR